MAKKNYMSKSVESIDSLVEELKTFVHIPLKAALSTKPVDEKELEKINKSYNEASETAVSLRNAIIDLKAMVEGVKDKASSRFASRVVSRFLEDR